LVSPSVVGGAFFQIIVTNLFGYKFQTSYISSMKPNINKYPAVNKLPSNAITVRDYAEQNGITTSYVYKQIREKKAKFKVVVFHTINFIIPD
jgi:hypothetical protein